MSNAPCRPSAYPPRPATPTERRRSFTAIDFETATTEPNSSCATGLPSIVVVGIPECWVDARRVARLLRWQPANDNDCGNVVAGAVE